MIAEVSAVTFRSRLGEMLAHVQFGHNSVVVTKDGHRVAALIDADLFNRIRALRQRFDELSDRLARSYASVPEADGLTEIDQLAAAERHRS